MAVGSLVSAPQALVFEHLNHETNATGAGQLLRTAGFTVREATGFSDEDFRDVDLLVLGSFVSDRPGYAAFMQDHAPRIRNFVASGGVVLQLTSRREAEARPAYLPSTLAISRSGEDHREIFALQPKHPLLADVPVSGDGSQVFLPPHLGHLPSWQTLERQQGFGVLLCSDLIGAGPVLVEGAFGRGRFLLTSLAFDRQYRGAQLVAPSEYQVFARLFFRNLQAYVEAVRGGRSLPVVVSDPVDSPTPGSWCLVVLPDTQYYVTAPATNAHLFRAQTEWIVRERSALDIRFAMHLGDITESNAPTEWRLAREIMGILDGRVPYSVIPGNHDLGPNGSAVDRSTHLSTYFAPESFQQMAGFGGVMEPGRMENSYHHFEAGGEKWLVLALEWSPRDPVVAWANQIVGDHPEHRVIVVTHAYLYFDDSRYDWSTRRDQGWSPAGYGTVRDSSGWNDGEALWQKLVSRHPNIVLVANGHVLGDGLGFLTSVGSSGNPVHQMLVNFQMRPSGGEGYLRILEVAPDQRTVRVRDYSPGLGRFLLGHQSNFRFRIEPGPRARGVALSFAPNQVLEMAPDSRVVLSPAVTGSTAARGFQWRKDGTPIPGATTTVFQISALATSGAGAYTLMATTWEGSTITWSAEVRLTSRISKIANVSVRGSSEGLLLGTVAGPAAADLLLRAAGPALARVGVMGFQPDPRLIAFDSFGYPLATNDNWGDGPDASAITSMGAQVGAVPFTMGSKDAALFLRGVSGPLTAACESTGGNAGVVLMELFRSGRGGESADAEIRNFSIRARTAAGDCVVTAGFVLDGAAARTVLIRAVGPGLQGFGVHDFASDPFIALHDREGRVVAANDDWAEHDGVIALRAAGSSAGAFELSRGSRDAALLVSLPPGAYSAACGEKSGRSGSVLIEVYVLP